MNQQGRTIAPYEKHLERWIIDNAHEFGYHTEDSWVQVADRIVASQYPLTCGRPDLIVLNSMQNGNLSVVELKHREIDAKAVVQLLRYMGEMKTIAYVSLYTKHGEEVRNTPGADFIDLSAVQGILVGSVIKDDNVLAACEAQRIIVLLYDYDPVLRKYFFERVDDFGMKRSYAVDIHDPTKQHLFREFTDLYKTRIAKGVLS